MADYERDFKGVWIPKIVWLDERLNALDKIILTEIDSLDNGERGCFASNKHIADFCQCSETKVSTAISKLIKLEYIYVQKFDGRQRELKSRLSNFERQDLKNCNSAIKDLKESNTKSNTFNNTSSKKERKKSSYDEILSKIEDDELRELYYEFIKMRQLIKKPMTDRALKMLIKRVGDLEPLDISRQKQMLENAIMKNWLSVFPLKDDVQSKNQQTNSYRRSEPQEDEMARTLREMYQAEKAKKQTIIDEYGNEVF